ncbi:MAG: NAD-binding protein [Pegethrix bostrychoides GSE-TBD4-15B]|jgi:Trk K+ transport system NAD-binding subunit|uniref:NAD-binding protein n=1 Tax=Pegethrix bostrychoides GSE-TBD4-15B TaxID=2839662 RepID=A0A951PBT7_9CYAN|nr:NAD-binding protein [Pegethrix bostrychoides GSE-TBD4-15B]
MKTRIIVCGLGRTGYQVFRLLKQQGAIVVGINQCPLPEADLALEDDIIVGELSAASTLLAAGIREANTLVITSSDDALNLAVLTQARVLNPQVRIVNRLFNASLGDRLDHTLPDHFSMSVAELAAPVFTFAALGNQAIGQLRMFNQTWPIREEYIDEDHPWRGRKLSEFWEERSRMLIYYLPARNQMDLVSAVVCGKHLQPGDRLIVATQPQVRAVQRNLRQKLSGIWTGIYYLQQHVRPTLLVMLVLLSTIFGSTLLYTAFSFHTSLIDALYFSVGLITGAGGNEQVVESAPTDIKLFTVVLMLVGAAVIGIFYALLNDIVLGTRLQQIWSTARVPQHHHYIVCGLGSVGIEIITQLQASGHAVMAIERDPNNRFLSLAQSLKVPVIQGEANLATTLKTAYAEGAAALIAVTSNDVTNLEIALTAKGLAPKLPVIVRNQNPQFAPMAQRVFDFEAVFSPAELAAPSFAAAALGGRILGNGMTADILWVALATLITPAHPFCGQRVKEAATDVDFVPLYLEKKHQTTHGWNLLDLELNPGDVLYLTMPATQLELLWRSQPSALASQLNYSGLKSEEGYG